MWCQTLTSSHDFSALEYCCYFVSGWNMSAFLAAIEALEILPVLECDRIWFAWRSFWREG